MSKEAKAGKKKAVKKASDKEARDRIFTYIKEQNRPFSHKLVFENLHGKTTGLGQKKVTDTLNQLVEEGEISSKSFKKKAVYWADQSKLEVLSADELKEMVASNAQLAAEAAALSEEVASLQDRNTKLSAQKKTVDIAKEIKDLEKKKEEQEEKLKLLAQGKKVDPKEKAQKEKLFEKARNEWKNRKRTFKEMADTFEENMDGKQFKKIKLDLGIETDEDMNIDFNNTKTESILKRR